MAFSVQIRIGKRNTSQHASVWPKTTPPAPVFLIELADGTQQITSRTLTKRETVIGTTPSTVLKASSSSSCHATLAGHALEHGHSRWNARLCIDANRGDYQRAGWDTTSSPSTTSTHPEAMMQIILNGGLGNGGTNFDAKPVATLPDLEDIFIAPTSRAWMLWPARSAAALLEESPYKDMLRERYASFDAGRGQGLRRQADSQSVYAYGKEVGEPKRTSGKPGTLRGYRGNVLLISPTNLMKCSWLPGKPQRAFHSLHPKLLTTCMNYPQNGSKTYLFR